MSEASQSKQTPVEIKGGDRGEREDDACGNKFIFPEDGYAWKKYGQKFIKNIGKNRSYFKCQKNDCFARKKVEWSTSKHGSVRVVYEGLHKHVSLVTESSSSQSQTPSSSANQYNLWTQVFGDRSASSHDRGEREDDARGNKFIFPEDGYAWKKYGQKFIKNIGKNRSYFKYRKSDCSARKKVEWSTSKHGTIRVVYEGLHKHVSLVTESSSSQSRTPSSSANQYNLWTQVFGDRSASSHDRGERKDDAQGNKFIFPEDGYTWKKYGQKFIKNIGKNRSYFKCRKSDCSARKKIEWSTLKHGSVRVVYEGLHKHVSLVTESSSSRSQTPSSSANQYNLWTQVFGDQ